MSIQFGAEHGITGHGEGEAEPSEQHQGRSWNQIKPAWAIEHEETKRPPTIPKRSQMRPMRFASVGIKSDRHFDNLLRGEAAPDDHLRGKLHSDALLFEIFKQLPGEAAKSAVNIMDRGSKHFLDKKRE